MLLYIKWVLLLFFILFFYPAMLMQFIQESYSSATLATLCILTVYFSVDIWWLQLSAAYTGMTLSVLLDLSVTPVINNSTQRNKAIFKLHFLFINSVGDLFFFSSKGSILSLEHFSTIITFFQWHILLLCKLLQIMLMNILNRYPLSGRKHS